MWTNNPYARFVDGEFAGRVVPIDYRPGIGASQRGYGRHFLTWFHEVLKRQLGVDVPVTRPAGELFFSAAERPRAVDGRYWVVVAGGKIDMTAKWWPTARYQAVVDLLRAAGVHCVQAGAHMERHRHGELANCVSALGATDSERDLFRLIRDADGVVCGVTAAMHIAAALGKPAVVVAGGREERTWEAYTNEGQWPASASAIAVPHTYFDTMGRYPCCTGRGCWRKQTAPVTPQDLARPDDVCARPLPMAGSLYPECLLAITPEQVADAVLSYYRNGVLPPPDAREPRLLLPRSSLRTPKAPPRYLTMPPIPETEASHLSQVEKNHEAALGLDVVVPFRAVDPYAALDLPHVGGKLTVFVLCYGDYPGLARTCVESILATLPAERIDLRIGLNQVCEETSRYAESLRDRVGAALYPDAGDRRKYPAMRQMFNDPSRPIATPYLVWFDDDTKVVDPQWAVKLARLIAAHHADGGRVYGSPRLHDLRAYERAGRNPMAWFRSAAWWKGRPLALRDGRTTGPDGRCALFPVGYHWAMATHLVRDLDVPDRRIAHNGDACLGFQLLQSDYKLIPYNVPEKSLVWCPTRENGGRRGYSSDFPWAVG